MAVKKRELPEVKSPQYREVPRKKGDRVKKIKQVFVVPGPNAEKYPGGADAFICPAGKGLGPVPKEGRWYDVTNYILARIRDGDLAEGTPPTPVSTAVATVPKTAKAKPKE